MSEVMLPAEDLPVPPSNRPQKRARFFLSRVALKPYGDNLLTRGGDFWIFGARIIIIIMAAAEAISWGYMGSLIGRSYAGVAATVAAVFIFSVVWIVDASFMTLDLSRAMYERLFGEKEATSTLKERLKFGTGVVARIVIVLGSLFITAPFLAQLLFSKDVKAEIERRNGAMVAEQRAEISTAFEERLAGLYAQKRALEDQQVKEAAGIGPSGRYGRGPALETIEAQLAAKDQEIGEVQAEHLAALAKYDQLSDDQLSTTYGIRFIEEGVQSAGQVLEDVLRNPTYSNAELAIRAFLSFLFIGLFILKAFQPRSIAVYFNEQLQSLYAHYQQGFFDLYLPERERADAGRKIDPLRFEEWCLNTYAVLRDEDRRRRESERAERVYLSKVGTLLRLEAETRRELEPLVREYEHCLEERTLLQKALSGTAARLTEQKQSAEGTEEAARTLMDQLEKGSLSGDGFSLGVKAREQLVSRLGGEKQSVRELDAEAGELRQRLDFRNATAEAVKQEIERKQAVLHQVQSEISAERIEFAKRVGESPDHLRIPEA